VNDPFLVGVLYALANMHEQLEAIGSAEAVTVTVFGDRYALDVLHDKVRSTLFGGSGVEDARDVGMVHER